MNFQEYGKKRHALNLRKNRLMRRGLFSSEMNRLFYQHKQRMKEMLLEDIQWPYHFEPGDIIRVAYRNERHNHFHYKEGIFIRWKVNTTYSKVGPLMTVNGETCAVALSKHNTILSITKV